MVKKVAIHILNYNHERFLGHCIESLKKQTYKNIEIIVSDNNSSDNSVSFLKKNYPEITLNINKKNLGYAAGHNRAINFASFDYLVPLNADIVLAPDFIKEKVLTIETDNSIGMVEGKLYKTNEDFDLTKSDEERYLDSTGLVFYKSRKNYERGSGQKDIGQFEEIEYIFGAFGASAMYSKQMLEDIKIGEEYFDEDFFMYREEVDLAWRAQLYGWECLYTPKAVAYHVHSYTPETRKQQPKQFRQMQFRNRYLMIAKNDSLINLIYHIPYILLYEILALGYVVLREPHLIKGYSDFFRLLPNALKKRKIILKNKKVTDKYIRSLFAK